MGETAEGVRDWFARRPDERDVVVFGEGDEPVDGSPDLDEPVVTCVDVEVEAGGERPVLPEFDDDEHAAVPDAEIVFVGVPGAVLGVDEADEPRIE